ncbi:hypothetical protein Tco_0715915, partial [Tanacetum coccineum]
IEHVPQRHLTKRTQDYWMSGQMENGQTEIEFFQHGLLMVEMICQQMLHVEPKAVRYGASNTIHN